MWPIGGIFAYSGGAPVNVDAINAAPVHAVDESAAQATARWCATSRASRRATRRTTSTAIGPKLFALGGDPKPPPPLFEYLANGAPPLDRHRRRSSSASASMPGYDPTWTWDGASGTWKRSIERRAAHRGRRHADRADQRGGAVHALRRRGRGRRPSARATCGSSPTARCGTGRGCGPTRPSRRATSTPPASRSCCARGARGSSCCRSDAPVDVVDAPAAATAAAGHRPRRRRPTKKKKQENGVARPVGWRP